MTTGEVVRVAKPGLHEAGGRCFQEIEAQAMVKTDFENHLIWIPQAIGYNLPANPNVVKSWRKEFLLLSECQLKAEAESAIYRSGRTASPMQWL